MDLALNFNNFVETKSDFKPIRGDIYLAKISISKENSSIQQGTRPIAITSNYKCNQYSTVYSCAPITSKTSKNILPTHVKIGYESHIERPSTILIEQSMPIDKSDLIHYIGHCPEIIIKQIDEALRVQFALNIKDDGNMTTINEASESKEAKEQIKNKFIKLIGAIDALNEMIYVIKINSEEVLSVRDLKLKEIEEFCKLYNIPLEYAKKKMKKY